MVDLAYHHQEDVQGKADTRATSVDLTPLAGERRVQYYRKTLSCDGLARNSNIE